MTYLDIKPHSKETTGHEKPYGDNEYNLGVSEEYLEDLMEAIMDPQAFVF